MKIRLIAHLTVLVFLGVMVSPIFSSFHNPYSRHIDQTQAQHLESHTRKDKKHFQYLGFLSTPPEIAFRTFYFFNPSYENSPPACSSAVIVSCRAPPA
jgi:hypothetical protein